MLSSTSSKWVLSFLLFDISLVLGRTLVPIHPQGPAHNRKRAQPADLDLKSEEVFLWGDEGVNIPVANLTVSMPGATEGIVSMERFDGMLTATECNADNIALTFEDDATFLYAQQVWDWVNGADNHSFVMIAGAGDCGKDTKRTPFVISTIQYDEVANKAVLAAEKSSWEKIAHTYELTVGSVSANTTTTDIVKRNVDKQVSADFVHDLPFSLSVSANGLSGSIACTNCSTAGAFDMEYTIKQKLFVPVGAHMKLKPRGVSAIAQVKLTGSGTAKSAITKLFTLLSIPINALSIPGVFELGPFLTVSVGAEISAMTLSAGIQTGAKATLSDDAILEIDMLKPEENSFSGWAPKVEPLEFKADGSVSGGVAIFLRPALVLKASTLGQGFEVGINMRIPNLSAKITATASPEGVCPAVAPAPQTDLGVKLSANIGGSINFAVNKANAGKTLFTVALATLDKPIASTCFPFGNPIVKRDMTMIRGAGRPSINA
ncbi:hypothetical protein K504DRAFT_531975 [Pleomassaria siparia CBS 279.74]|uniref:Uncharacterized protein n=1 Tax=Pleomassaria siparia CBS 279.74 TaxID=1314801 RepID=A0A6G1KEV0_9PLEO|nr:hypothetical protein K504DRAFT_531975 [Pleomassaria siparia CBS 279.74]